MKGDRPRADDFAVYRVRGGPARRRLVWTLLVSLGVHVFLTPVAAWLGLLAWLLHDTKGEDDTPVEQLTSIPISLFEEAPPPEAEPPGAEPAAPPPPTEVPPPRAEATAPTPPAPKPAPPALKPPQPPAKAAGKPGRLDHPVQVSGVQSQIVDSNANVSLLLLSDRVRGHRQGQRIGRLLVGFPQWQSFLETTGIDPIEDLDRVLVVGPQFRRSADVVVIIQYRVETAEMRASIDRLVQREPRGEWISDKPPAARAHADRAQRLFVFSGPRILVIAPPHLERQLLGASIDRFPEPGSDDALVVNIKTPWRALMGLPFELPKSLAWARLGVLPLADGGAQLRVEAEDADAAQAEEHAYLLERAINALTNPELGALGALLGVRSLSFLDPIELEARGRRIRGELRVKPAQLERLLTYAEEMVRQWTGRRAPAPVPSPTQPSPAPAPLPSATP
ncbi:MAG: hypothetical protein ABW217_00075 [Polyangiaceae bacterium]